MMTSERVVASLVARCDGCARNFVGNTPPHSEGSAHSAGRSFLELRRLPKAVHEVSPVQTVQVLPEAASCLGKRRTRGCDLSPSIPPAPWPLGSVLVGKTFARRDPMGRLENTPSLSLSLSLCPRVLLPACRRTPDVTRSMSPCCITLCQPLDETSTRLPFSRVSSEGERDGYM